MGLAAVCLACDDVLVQCTPKNEKDMLDLKALLSYEAEGTGDLAGRQDSLGRRL